MEIDFDQGRPLDAPHVLFFDRDVGTALPKALDILKLPTRVEYHQSHFPINAQDDAWMATVGDWGWTLIGHDSRHHLVDAEVSAIKQYEMGCFYLWGAKAPRWEKMRCFLRAYENIVEAAGSTPRPFIYRVTEKGRLTLVTIPINCTCSAKNSRATIAALCPARLNPAQTTPSAHLSSA